MGTWTHTYSSVPVAQWLEHCVSSAKVVGSIPREHTYWQKMYSLNRALSLWIKASDKCTHGHTLDLVFTHGFSTGLSDILISDTWFSDHKSVCFNASHSLATCQHGSVHNISDFTDASPWNSNIDEYLYFFNDKCLNILNSVAPMKAKRINKKIWTMV